MTGFVYFIKPVGIEGPIKIGHSVLPLARVQQLAAWSPFPLEVIVTVPGSLKLEHNIHDCFADDHSHCEWFRASDRLRHAVNNLRGGLPLEQVIDLADRRGSVKNQRRILSEEAKLCAVFQRRIRAACRRAEKSTRPVFWISEPESVAIPMNKWRGTFACGRTVYGPRPTSEELEQIEAFILDPIAHGIKMKCVINAGAAA